MRSARRLALTVILVVAACDAPGVSSSIAGPSARSERVELTIYAAASLAGVLEEAEAAYEAADPGTTLTIATDSSAALRTQIELGAPADVFLSADTTEPQVLVEAGLVDGSPVHFAGNLLTIIAPADDPAAITMPGDLAREGLRIVAAGEEVPITRYAVEVIENLAELPGHPADFAARYAANIVSREDNVKAVLAKIELGEGDAGIVYVTDAMTSTRVIAVEIPDEANVRAAYAGVVVKASAHAARSHAFLDWLSGPDGQAILAEFGFIPPP